MLDIWYSKKKKKMIHPAGDVDHSSSTNPIIIEKLLIVQVRSFLSSLFSPPDFSPSKHTTTMPSVCRRLQRPCYHLHLLITLYNSLYHNEYQEHLALA